MDYYWDTESDTRQADKIITNHLIDIQQANTFSLSLAFRMTTRQDIRDKIERVTRDLHDDYKSWQAEWIKHPSYETLIPRLNHHLDVYEDLLKWINKETKASTDQPIQTADKLDLVLSRLDDLTAKTNQAGGLLAKIAVNTEPKSAPKSKHAVSQMLAAEILTKLGWPTTSRTIQNWEAGIGTPNDYSADKCRISIQAFQAWANGYVSVKKFDRQARNNLRNGKDIQ